MDQIKRINRELACKGNLVDFYRDRIEINGERQTTFDFVHHNGAAAMVAVDGDGKILMVRQYRNAIDSSTLEIPAGGLNIGEDSRLCAMRECEEETGYRAENAFHLLDVHTTVAFSNEKISIYYSENVKPSKQNLDQDEFVTVEKYTMDELVTMILENRISDAKTVAGLLSYRALKERQK